MEIQAVVFRLLPVLSALAVASLVEVLVPLRRQSRRANGRLATNLWLLAITLALATLLNFTLALGAAFVGQQRPRAAPIAWVGRRRLLRRGIARARRRHVFRAPPAAPGAAAVARASRASHRRVRGRDDRVSSAPDRRHPALRFHRCDGLGAWERRPQQSLSIVCSARSTPCWSMRTFACRRHSTARWCGSGSHPTCTRFITRATASRRIRTTRTCSRSSIACSAPSRRAAAVRSCRYGIRGYDAPEHQSIGAVLGCRSTATRSANHENSGRSRRDTRYRLRRLFRGRTNRQRSKSCSCASTAT